MLLRRITEHVTDQNWFAVGIDFAIVVIGVFIGIQVANWNESQVAKDKGEMFTERLISDLRDEAWIYHYFVSYQENVLLAAERAQHDMEADNILTSEEFLINAYRASQYTWWIQRRGAFDELMATGDLGLIEDEMLLRTALAVYSSPLRRDIERRGENSAYRVAFRRTIPTDIHHALNEVCGDLSIPLGEFDRLSTVLSYDCKLNLPPEKIEAAERALKANLEFLPSLRLRIANLETELTDLKENSEVTQFFQNSRETEK